MSFWNMLGGTQDDQQLNESRSQLTNPTQANYQVPGYAGLQSGYGNVSGGAYNAYWDPTQSNQARGSQQDATSMLRNQAMGLGPSVAQAQMNNGLSQGLANLHSLSSSRGYSGGLGERNLLNAGASLQGQLAGQAGIARATEQVGALGAYGQQTNAVRGQDISQQNGMAQTQLGNANVRLQGLNGASQLAQRQAGLNADYDQNRVQSGYNNALLYNNQNNQQSQGFNNAVTSIGRLAQAGASLAGIPGVGGLFGGGGGASAPSAGVSGGYMLPGEGHWSEGIK